MTARPAWRGVAVNGSNRKHQLLVYTAVIYETNVAEGSEMVNNGIV